MDRHSIDWDSFINRPYILNYNKNTDVIPFVINQTDNITITNKKSRKCKKKEEKDKY